MISRFFERVHAAVGPHLMVDRTSLEARLESVVVGIECAPPESGDAAIACELLVNQLARLYPSLCLVGDDAGVARATEVARSIHPGIRVVEDPALASVGVETWTGVFPSSVPVVRMAIAGWSAMVGHSVALDRRDRTRNPFAAAAGASLANAAVFRRILLRHDETALDTRHLDLFRFGSTPDADAPALAGADLDGLMVVGVGAVGNAALWVLGQLRDCRGEVLVVEPETVDLSNLQRYVLTTDGDVGVEKTTLAGRALAATGLSLRVEKKRIEDVEPTSLPSPLRRVLVTVDNVRGRRIAQALLPRQVFNGWTSATGLGASWHDFGEKQACLACLYHPQGPAPSQIELVASALGLTPLRAGILWISPETVNAQDVGVIATKLGATTSELRPWIGKRLQDVYTHLVCGSAAIAVSAGGRQETVPLVHQSVLAGVLAAAELVKRSVPAWAHRLPSENAAAWHDVTRAAPSTWLQARAPVTGCICRDPVYRRVFDERWLSSASSAF